MQKETREKSKNEEPRSLEEVWGDLKKELKQGEGSSKEFNTVPKVDVAAVLELQRRGYISICQLKIKIIEKYRGEEV